MKHTVFFLIMLSVFYLNYGYAQLSGKESRQHKKELKAQEIEQLVLGKQFVFKAKSLTTSSGFHKYLNSSYDLVLKPDSAFVHLPYWGRVYMARIDDENGFMFDEQIKKLEFKDRGKKGYQLYFTLNNQGDSHQFTLDISTQGYAYLKVSSTRKSIISYDGTIEAIDNE